MSAKTATSKPKAAPRSGASKAPRRSTAARRSRPTPKVRASKPASPVTISDNVATKQAQLIELLNAGATMPQMTKLTGWQPHTVRGTISAVLRRKLGLTVSCAPDEAGVRVYRIAAAT